MENPAMQLATEVIERLIKEGLLRPDDHGKLLSRLAEGKLKQEDWRLAVELSEAKGRVK